MPAIHLTYNDVIFSVVGAAVLFIVIKVLSIVIKLFVTRTSEIFFDPDQLDGLLESCYNTFPIENLDFNGATFRRGTSVRVTTVRQNVIEGQFIGTNQSEMVCIVTDKSIIAQEIGAIQEIQSM